MPLPLVERDDDETAVDAAHAVDELLRLPGRRHRRQLVKGCAPVLQLGICAAADRNGVLAGAGELRGVACADP